MEYTQLTSTDFAGLRRERIVALEAEHYRLGLLIDELSNGDARAQLLDQQADIERRVGVHSALTDVPDIAQVSG